MTWNFGSRTRTRDRGTSLIEAVVTMSVGSTLFLLATAWIHQSFFIASKMRDQGRHHESLMRLSRQFRDDVHAASDITMIDDSNLRMATSPGATHYERTPKSVIRTEHPVDHATPMARETFQLLEGSEVDWSIEEDWLTMVVIRTRGTRTAIDPNQSSPSNLPSDLHVRAHIGRWLDGTSTTEDSP